MSDDQAQSTSKKSCNDAHIPPPTDPYVTYQTPYPRRPADENQNPFIEFRRLADAAFSSFFSGLPRFLGTEKFKENNIRESQQAYLDTFDRQAKEFEKKIADMVRTRTEEAEGFRKQLEQEWEERRRDNETRMEEENQRWEMMRRGLERCPGLRAEQTRGERESETELDLYDGLKAYESALYKPKSDAVAAEPEKCPWKDAKVDKQCLWNEEDKGRDGWLSGLGWDGRKRAKNIPLYVPHQQDVSVKGETNVTWRKYQDEDMDPFNNDDHVVPWLRLSPYSPLSLINSRAWNDPNVRESGGQHVQQELSELPWDEAFEDLMSIHKTGELPSLIRRLVYWGGPNQWMTDLALRGSLGPKWDEGFMVAALMDAVYESEWRGFAGFKERCKQLAGDHFEQSSGQPAASSDLIGRCAAVHGQNDEETDPDANEWVQLSRRSFDPRLAEASDRLEELAEAFLGSGSLPERAFGAHGMPWPSPEQVINAVSASSSAFSEDEMLVQKPQEDVALSAKSKEDFWTSTSVNSASWSSTEDAQPGSLLSTFTTTTTRTLPDGSVETKRVLKKRFADGREEKRESTEIVPSPKSATTQASTQTMTEEQPRKVEASNNSKGGWFWN